jgi:hypothetical protein
MGLTERQVALHCCLSETGGIRFVKDGRTKACQRQEVSGLSTFKGYGYATDCQEILGGGLFVFQGYESC